MHLEIKKGDKFRHFKGTVYTVIALAKHTETEEELVIYRDEQGSTWARPIEMFSSLVDKEKYPHIKQKYRFEKI
jgi:hypothetical protein